MHKTTYFADYANFLRPRCCTAAERVYPTWRQPGIWERWWAGYPSSANLGPGMSPDKQGVRAAPVLRLGWPSLPVLFRWPACFRQDQAGGGCDAKKSSTAAMTRSLVMILPPRPAQC